MRADLVSDMEGFARIEGRWRELAESAGNAFLSPEWFRCWLETPGRTEDWAVAVVPGERDRFDGVLPVILEGPPTRRTLRLSGGLGDHFHPLARYGDQSAIAAAAAEALHSSGQKITMAVLVNVDHGAAWPRELWVGPRRARANQQSESELPYVTLPSTWEEYLAGRSSNARQQIRRRERKLDKLGDVAFRSASPDTLSADLETLFDLHLRRWSERGRSSLEDPAARDYISRFAAAAQERGWLRLNVLEVDAQPVAAFFGWRLGARFAFYQSGFDPEWSEHSVGAVLLAKTIRGAIEEGAHEFDMLLGTEPYKRRFADRSRAVETVVVATAGSPRSMLLTGEAMARRQGRELARHPRLGKALRKVNARLPSAWRN